jgi:ACDE family multidrug resistance protein
MALDHYPVTLPRTPKLQHFAMLAGLEAAVRGSLISVMPLVVRDAMGSTQDASKVYFLAGLVSLCWGLMVPWANRHVPRRWMYTIGCSMYFVGMSLALVGTPLTAALSLMCNSMATVTNFVCFNAYVMDYVDRANLGRSQSLTMFYAATPWAVGPMLGVWLHDQWQPLPFLLAGSFAAALITTFWILRLGNGKQIAKATGPTPNPLAYLGRFFAQPRLIAGWIFAVIRSTGWWVYVVYLPYFCIEQGLGNKVGGMALSISNAMLFGAPFLLRFARRSSVRVSVRWAFGLCGGLFLMSVKPSERTEMSAVYSSFRDVSSIVTPGMAWAVLYFAPTAAIFAATAALMGAAWTIAGNLHPRLGTPRPSRARP